MVRLRRVDEEGVAQIHVTRFAGCERERFLFGKAQFFSQLEKRQPGLSRRLQQAWHVEMRTDCDARGRIIDSHVGEEEEHQENPTARRHTQAHGIVFAVEARVNVPACVVRNPSTRETNWECAQARSPQPPIRTYKSIEGVMQLRSVRCVSERLLCIISKAHDGPDPSRWIIGIASTVPPQDGATSVCQLRRKGALHANKPPRDESLDLFGIEDRRHAANDSRFARHHAAGFTDRLSQMDRAVVIYRPMWRSTPAWVRASSIPLWLTSSHFVRAGFTLQSSGARRRACATPAGSIPTGLTTPSLITSIVYR